jgi:hypothetical protein
MNNKAKKKKLSLLTETIRKLDPQRLRSVAGGAYTDDIYECRWVTFTER